jgi:cytoskeletal protein RodZ
VGQFGDKFREAREKKGISLDDVSNVTKISARMLQAIEEEHFDQLPGGVFNKGFIRAYAKHVGLDAEQAVNEYLACLRQAQIDAQAVWEPDAGTPHEKRLQGAAGQIAANQTVGRQAGAHQIARKAANRHFPTSEGLEELAELHLPRAEDVRPPRRQRGGTRDSSIPWRPAVLAVLLVIMVVVLWQRHARIARVEGAGALRPPSLATESAPPSPPVAEPATSSNVPASSKTVGNKFADNKGEAKTRLAKANSSPSATPASDAAAEKLAANVSNENREHISPEPAKPSAPEIAKSSAPAEAAEPAPLTLVIRADENSWISVTADGQPVSHETLIAPANTSVRAKHEIIARIGNAAGVSFIWNGQEIQPQGAEAEVKTFVFDVNGMRVLTPGPTPEQSR